MSAPVQLPMKFTLPVSYAAADFILGDANRSAATILDDLSRWPEPVLALVGPSGAGKTHLLHWLMERHQGVLLDAASIGSPPPAPFWALDDIAQFKGEEALVRLMNDCRAGAGKLLLAASEQPSRLVTRLPDLHSRLSAVITLTLAPTDEAMLAALLTKHFTDRQLRVAPEVIAYLVARMERSYEAAAHAAAWLDEAAIASARAVTLPLARQYLELQQAGLR
jgi:chromosomal replication initiation ATPase DnaA